MQLARFGITVSDIKTALADLGFYKGEITNEFDTCTAEAIAHFQEMNGLEADGIFGSMTYQRLASHLSTGPGE